ncbi:aminotransferase class I/II-fold pyridoxal phosphate-dependent enzyme [Serpentinicella alkaliphila]|uniref:Arginine decarboxylase n=1 Tax=Serpentinicella alkaliphila TaxID=1734049 RepID=A0A4R2TVV5_9FIRM|nr:aminotransferase class I/II-fold pyridoxal phosphate-dependent enzyme [Serpentinicella alkaliphila]QUH25113.1 aminotransferase class I/II-fold pyridoxal phosphate-dependent enzyme [Serpentinicella alkaliphila]TCQ01759.1 arginine decarboxylase [Serpentinicella alkaliphila]
MELPIIEYLIKLEESNVASFHVPGHKNGKIFKNFNHLFHKLSSIDTTEIPGNDNLHYPTGIIKDSLEIAKEVFKSNETFYLINGSTSGIYSMIMAVTSPGDKIIINRNCHQSVIHACVLGELSPIYVYPNIDLKTGIPLEICPEEIEKQILSNMDAKAILITYPTYEGVASDLKKIAEITHKYDKILLVDEAHGAHLGLSDDLPMTALECGADVVVQSTHKTLSALTQGAMLHVQGNKIDIDKLKFMLRMHQSSSPSYILMASLEFAVMMYKNYGPALMNRLLLNIKDFQKSMLDISSIGLYTVNLKGQHNIFSHDSTKLFLYSKDNEFSGIWLETHLRDKYNIQMELSNLNGALAIASIANDKNDFDKLLNALYNLDKQKSGKVRVSSYLNSYPTVYQKLKPREAIYSQKRRIEVKRSIGHISGEFITPYPPGIPLIIPGEVITEEVVQYLFHGLKTGINIVGLKDKMFEYIEVI